MRILSILTLLFLVACSGTENNNSNEEKDMTFNEAEILTELDLAFNNTPSNYFPEGQTGDVKYNFFLDLENGYCYVASSRIHLYADSTRWAIVFETAGYETRSFDAEITLNYIGNCIDYPIDKYPERSYITNSSRIILIEGAEFERIENKEGSDSETFELIDQNIKEIKIRDKYVSFDNNYKNYEKTGIEIRDYDNPKNLIDFKNFVRFLNETDPVSINATEDEILKHIPKDLPKLMTIDKFHFVSAYEKTNPPSNQETYKLIAKILTTRDTTNWKPTQKSNNHWKNWDSGSL